MNIFVGNLLFEATEADLKRLFEGFGNVSSATIIMEKKGVKSRGFGFVEMPDDMQAQDAISALDGKDFMGRALNVSPANSKPESGRDIRKKEKILEKMKVSAEQLAEKERSPKKAWYGPVFYKEGGYKGGRRSRSFRRKQSAAGIEEKFTPKRKAHENPMRWRKKQEQPKPWQKTSGESSPWQKSAGEPKPWKKSSTESKPSWRKSSGESKPWQKTNGEPKLWKRTEGKPGSRNKSKQPKKNEKKSKRSY